MLTKVRFQPEMAELGLLYECNTYDGKWFTGLGEIKSARIFILLYLPKLPRRGKEREKEAI